MPKSILGTEVIDRAALDQAIEKAHPEADECELANLKYKVHNGFRDQRTLQLLEQQQLQRQNNQRR